MPIGKNSINRVAEGLNGEHAAPLNDLTAATAIEVATVEGTAAVDAPAPTVAEVEKAIVEGTVAEVAKTATKKKTVAKPAETETAEAPAAEATVAPELVGQSVAAPVAPRRRGRKPGSKNKPKTPAVPEKKTAAKKTVEKKPAARIPRAPETAKRFLAVGIGEELPVYLL